MNFGTILKKLRKDYKYTQEQLADRLGVANSTVSMYERGERFPDYEMMIAISDIFNVDMNVLYGKKPTSKLLSPSFPLTPHETSVIIAYRNHPSEQPIIDKILDVPAEEETVTLYSAAYSKDNTPEEIITISKAEWERLKSLPFTDQDL